MTNRISGAKTRELTDQQLAFLEALGGEAKGDITKAKQLAGYSSSTTNKTLVDSLGEEMIQVANNILRMNAAKAAFNMAGLLDSPDALGARNLINAAGTILDRVGIVKKEQVEVKSEGASIFILPAKRTESENAL